MMLSPGTADSTQQRTTIAMHRGVLETHTAAAVQQDPGHFHNRTMRRFAVCSSTVHLKGKSSPAPPMAILIAEREFYVTTANMSGGLQVRQCADSCMTSQSTAHSWAFACSLEQA